MDDVLSKIHTKAVNGEPLNPVMMNGIMLEID
jgi:hypothetical protein